MAKVFENEHLDVNRRALKRYEESVVFWNAIGSGQPVVATSSEVLSESWPPPTPDQAIRAAHGSRNA